MSRSCRFVQKWLCWVPSPSHCTGDKVFVTSVWFNSLHTVRLHPSPAFSLLQTIYSLQNVTLGGATAPERRAGDSAGWLPLWVTNVVYANARTPGLAQRCSMECMLEGTCHVWPPDWDRKLWVSLAHLRLP